MDINWRNKLKQTRFKLAFLSGGSVILTLLLLLLIFNIGTRMQMDQRAREAIQSAFTWDWSNEQPSLYYAEAIPFGQNYEPLKDEPYSSKELSLLKWCKDHADGTLQREKIGVRSYYLKSQPADGSNDQLHGTLFYIDYTDEPEMIRRMNLLFLAASAVVGLLASLGGLIIGKRLEQNALLQKRFFENTSHELKTPLTTIRGYAEGIETGIIHDYKKTARVIMSQTDRMGQLIEDILAMAKIEGKAMILHTERIELAEFLMNCLMPFEGIAANRSIEV